MYGKIKQRRHTGCEWLIGVYTQNTPYLSTVPSQHKTRQRRVRDLLRRIKARRHAGV